MSWTQEQIDRLCELWKQGQSASAIAADIGNVTRNAVIGKAHRLGLTARPSPIKRSVTGDSKPPARRRQNGIGLLELSEDTCRWPIGDPRKPGFAFCGRTKLVHTPYCERHTRLAYQPGGRSAEPKSEGDGADAAGASETDAST